MKNTLAKITLGILFSLLVLLPALCAPAAADASNTIDLSLGDNELNLFWTGENYTLAFAPDESGVYRFEFSGSECDPIAHLQYNDYSGEGGFAFTHPADGINPFCFELELQGNTNEIHTLSVSVTKAEVSHDPSDGEAIELSLGTNELRLYWGGYSYHFAFTPQQDGVYRFEVFGSSENIPGEGQTAIALNACVDEDTYSGNNIVFTRELTTEDSFVFSVAAPSAAEDINPLTIVVTEPELTALPGEDVNLSLGDNELTLFWTGDAYTLSFTPEKKGVYLFESSGVECDPYATVGNEEYDNTGDGQNFAFYHYLTDTDTPFTFELKLHEETNETFELSVSVTKLELSFDPGETVDLSLGTNELNLYWLGAGQPIGLIFWPGENGVYRFEFSDFGGFNPTVWVFDGSNDEYEATSGSNGFFFTRTLTAGDPLTFNLDSWDPAKLISLTITVTPPEYSVTVTSGGNGTAGADAETSASGKTVTLTATPDEGYRFKEWQVLSGDVTVENDQFEMPTEDVEIKAIFELIPAYTLSAPNPVEINPNDVWTAMTFNMPDLNFDLADDGDDRTPNGLRLVLNGGTLTKPGGKTIRFDLSNERDEAQVRDQRYLTWGAANTPKTMYLYISPSAWSAAEPGTYTGSISYHFMWRYATGNNIWSSNFGSGTIPVTVTVPEPVPAFDGQQLVLNGQLGMYFYMEIPDEYVADSTMEFTINGVTTNVPTAEAKRQDDGRYRFLCTVNALQMADTITAAFRYTVGEEEKTLSESTTVERYLNILIIDPDYADAADAAKAINDYGYYAQLALHNDGIDHASMSTVYKDGNDLMTGASSISDYYWVVAHLSGYYVTGASYSLSATSETALNLYFKLTDEAPDDIADSVVIDADDPETDFGYTAEKSGNLLKVQITGIDAVELGTMFKVTLTQDGTTLEASPLSYVRNILQSEDISDDMKYTAAALYAVHQEMCAYLGIQS